MNDFFELFIIGLALTFTVGGGIVLSTLFYIDDHHESGAGRTPSTILPHENDIKEHEARFDDEKHAA